MTVRFFVLLILLLQLPAAFATDKILLVGDSHMAGALGDALVPLFGGPRLARRYGIVSATAKGAYVTNAPVQTICPEGCEMVCPSTAPDCRYVKGYRTPKDSKLMLGRVPENFPRMLGLLEEEKQGLSSVLVELGTNEAIVMGCGKVAISWVTKLLAQAKSTGKRCIFVGPPTYVDGPAIDSCKGVAKYQEFVRKLLESASSQGCQAIDSTAVRDAAGKPVLCKVDGLHCQPGQAKIWANYVKSQIP
jgi:hypothetical protein